MVKRTLNELTLKDNFMFGAVMSDEENCRRLRAWTKLAVKSESIEQFIQNI